MEAKAGTVWPRRGGEGDGERRSNAVNGGREEGDKVKQDQSPDLAQDLTTSLFRSAVYQLQTKGLKVYAPLNKFATIS